MSSSNYSRYSPVPEHSQRFQSKQKKEPSTRVETGFKAETQGTSKSRKGSTDIGIQIQSLRKVSDLIQQKPTEEVKKERRSKDRLSHLSKLLPQKPNWKGYLDVGCGNAEISAIIAQALGISMVYGADIFKEEDFIQPEFEDDRSEFPTIQYKQNQDNELQFPKDSVDLVTCFMAIHHFEYIDKMLMEIQRVLAVDGYLFIREHDVPKDDKETRNLIEETHRKYPDHQTDGYMKLFDREELKEVLTKYGFDHLGDSNYTGTNPQAVYHSLFTLKEKVQLDAKQMNHNKQEQIVFAKIQNDGFITVENKGKGKKKKVQLSEEISVVIKQQTPVLQKTTSANSTSQSEILTSLPGENLPIIEQLIAKKQNSLQKKDGDNYNKQSIKIAAEIQVQNHQQFELIQKEEKKLEDQQKNLSALQQQKNIISGEGLVSQGEKVLKKETVIDDDGFIVITKKKKPASNLLNVEENIQFSSNSINNNKKNKK